ncbi:MAG: cyclic-di-AMP phosphodiesterase [Tepidanaerobacteraceae bacterium]|nr:cyclic-di-AMP phosphodiesterase [Tepidanaerobacteraceae bacterium]
MSCRRNLNLLRVCAIILLGEITAFLSVDYRFSIALVPVLILIFIADTLKTLKDTRRKTPSLPDEEKTREKAETLSQIEEPATNVEEERLVMAYIQVDNFDEIMSVCQDENRPELLARIDKIITQWVQKYNGFIRKYESDKFVAVFSKKELDRVEEDKFSILEEIKELKVGPAIMVTLSIGIAYGQNTVLETSRMALNALELCLGRGGDQIVIKAGGKTQFFGGKTREMEKYSRVRARVISHALRDLIEESDAVMTLGHVFMDMDALGAGAGIVTAAKGLGKPGYILLSPEQSPSVESLMSLLLEDEELCKVFIKEEAALDKMTKKTLVVVADTHRPSFCLSQKILQRAEKIVVIDHHRRGEEFIDNAFLVYLEPYASSTSEMVTEMLEYMGEEVKLSPLAATALLSGIAVDTGHFSFKTGVRTFEAASYLRRMGADPTMVFKLFQEDMETVNARAEVVKRAKVHFGHIAISYYLEKPKNPSLSAAQAANSLLEIKGINASFVLVPTDEGISISARSLGDVNVQRVLEKLGGGGHMTVAGAQLKNTGIKEALEKLQAAILEYMKEGETA